MLLDKVERLLLGGGVLDQFAERLQLVAAVGVSRLAGAFDRRANGTSFRDCRIVRNAMG